MSSSCLIFAEQLQVYYLDKIAARMYIGVYGRRLYWLDQTAGGTLRRVDVGCHITGEPWDALV